MMAKPITPIGIAHVRKEDVVISVIHDEFMLPREVAKLFRVNIRTVNSWVRAGRMTESDFIRTPGGQYRFRRTAIQRLAEKEEM